MSRGLLKSVPDGLILSSYYFANNNKENYNISRQKM